MPSAFTGEEALSSLFSFQVELVADNSAAVPFEQLVGQSATLQVALQGGGTRQINGMISRFAQGARGHGQTAYSAELVPRVWTLTRIARSRIFQELSVPDILARILLGYDVDFRIQGTFQPRDYVVQYRESDFDFASRLMEEEGIFYFFEHSDGAHTMVIANSPAAHPSLLGQGTIRFGGPHAADSPAIINWGKVQELRSGRYTLWDHAFQTPAEHYEAQATIQQSVPVGETTHQLQVGGNDAFEIYDYPGGYAQRFDDVTAGGGSRPGELAKILPDGQRTAAIRMQEEAVHSIQIQGTATARNLAAGHRFTLARHFNGDGSYVLTRVRHKASLPRGPGSGQLEYRAPFECIPIGLPFRPARLTPRPLIAGTQTAVVVGPAGEQIYTDKYGRVKVQFFWDREGHKDQHSSCWIRVGALHQGEESGFEAVPKIGDEVVIAFEEGDPDQPIIIGSVWNGDRVPPPGL